jgi:hypothetical protein
MRMHASDAVASTIAMFVCSFVAAHVRVDDTSSIVCRSIHGTLKVRNQMLQMRTAQHALLSTCM